MDLIFMLTHEDRTVSGCLEVLEEIAPLGLKHIGFKDVGADRPTLSALSRRIAALGATSYLEVVSTDREGCLAAARAAAELGVHKVMGGTDAAAMLSVLGPAGVSLLPFPGRPQGHPTKLGGDSKLVAEHCRAFVSQGCAGADLLAYRATEADPLELVRAAREGLGSAELVVAGSVVDAQQIAALAAAGADGFTVGGAVFAERWAPGQHGVLAQLKALLADLRAHGGNGRSLRRVR
ncbi:MAG TPA: hypothetical protein VGK67_33495 [Myxococcales bacterium]|jgi:hypothetical protein